MRALRKQEHARQGAGRRAMRQALQRRAQFIAPQGHRVLALGQCCLHLFEHRREARRIRAGQRAHMPAVEARARFGRAGLVVVEEGEAIVHEGQCKQKGRVGRGQGRMPSGKPSRPWWGAVGSMIA
jgi:hypothetical protein